IGGWTRHLHDERVLPTREGEEAARDAGAGSRHSRDVGVAVRVHRDPAPGAAEEARVNERGARGREGRDETDEPWPLNRLERINDREVARRVDARHVRAAESVDRDA